MIVGSYHGAPFAQDQRPDEARRVASAMTRPRGTNRRTIIGGDWNSITADRVQDPDGTWRFWHDDPYQTAAWREAYGYQCQVLETGPDGLPLRWQADRRPGEVLLRAGCRDTAALAGAAWAPSAGHDAHADMGPRTIDTLRVTPALSEMVTGWQTVDTPTTRTVSDHLPVVATLTITE